MTIGFCAPTTLEIARGYRPRSEYVDVPECDSAPINCGKYHRISESSAEGVSYQSSHAPLSDGDLIHRAKHTAQKALADLDSIERLPNRDASLARAALEEAVWRLGRAED